MKERKRVSNVKKLGTLCVHMRAKEATGIMVATEETMESIDP